jgi:hypothetical protein
MSFGDPAARATGVVHEHVDASEPRGCVLDELADIVWSSDVRDFAVDLASRVRGIGA